MGEYLRSQAGCSAAKWPRLNSKPSRDCPTMPMKRGGGEDFTLLSRPLSCLRPLSPNVTIGNCDVNRGIYSSHQAGGSKKSLSQNVSWSSCSASASVS